MNSVEKCPTCGNDGIAQGYNTGLFWCHRCKNSFTPASATEKSLGQIYQSAYDEKIKEIEDDLAGCREPGEPWPPGETRMWDEAAHKEGLQACAAYALKNDPARKLLVETVKGFLDKPLAYDAWGFKEMYRDEIEAMRAALASAEGDGEKE